MASRTRRPKPPKGEISASETIISTPLSTPDRLDTQYGSQVQRYSIPARNPVVKSALNIVSNGVFWTEGKVSANPENDYKEHPEFEELDNEIINLQQSQLNNIGTDKDSPPNVKKSPSFLESLKSFLDDGRIYGFAPSELVWNPVGGINTLQKIKSKPPWNFDINTELDEVVSVSTGASNKKEDPSRFVIGTWPWLKWGNYYGTSEMQSIEDDVGRMEILMDGLQKGGAWASYRPLITHVLTGAMGKEVINDSKTAIKEMSSATTTFLPKIPVGIEGEHKSEKGFEFEMMEDRASQYALENVFNIILEISKVINRCLGVPDDLGNVSTNAGSWAKAKTEFNLFIAKLEQCRQWVEEIAQRIIDTICYYNFTDLPKDYLLPVWKFGTIEEDADKVRIEGYNTLIQSGIIHSDEPWVREALNLPPKEEEFMNDTIPEDDDIEMEDQEAVQETQEVEDKEQSQTEGVGDLAQSLENAAKAAKGFNIQLTTIPKKTLLNKISDFIRGR